VSSSVLAHKSQESDMMRREQECGSNLVDNEVKGLLVLCLGSLGCESYNSIVLSKLKADVEVGGATGSRYYSIIEVRNTRDQFVAVSRMAFGKVAG